MLTKKDIEWLKAELSPHIVNDVVKQLGEKIDKMYTKLDLFIGDIQTKRTEQTLHAGQHRKINDRLDVVEKRLNITPKFD
jgi:hypothetical protein